MSPPRLRTVPPRVKSAPGRFAQRTPTAADRQARRALPTNSAAWRRLRASVLAAEPLCRECARKGRVTAATCVDHIDGNAMNNGAHALQPLCSPCHSRKTAIENGGFGNPKSQEN